MKKVLFLAYYFPPAGGAGVQRVVKFIKYLPQFGYDCAVVAGDGFIKDGPKDKQLYNEVANIARYDVEVNAIEKIQRRVNNSKIGKWLSATPMKYWLNAAVRAAQKAIEKEKPDVIFATVSPFIAAKVAMIVSGQYDIPWILDMRDPWALDPINFYPTKLHYRADLKNMKQACLDADAVIMNTPGSLEAVKANIVGIEPEKCFCITNGWDSDDFNNTSVSSQPDSTLKIVHTGLFHTKFALLVNPQVRKILGCPYKKIADRLRFNIANTDLFSRTPYYLFKAVRQLLDQNKISKTDIKLIFAGYGTSEDKKLADMFALADIFDYKGYINHSESIELLNSADVLFLPLHTPENGKPLIVPGKTYEYMASGKPILAVVPDGDCKDFVNEYNNSFITVPDDSNEMAKILKKLIIDKTKGDLSQSENDKFIARFERKKLTKKLADILDFAIKNRADSTKISGNII